MHFLALFLASSPVLALAPSAAVGTLPGELSVHGNGGATYTIPIRVPPGTNGVQPSLALIYDSQHGNGVLGVGFRLDGISSIARCPQTEVQDGAHRAINMTGRDRYCIDGQRLIAWRAPDGQTLPTFEARAAAYGLDGTLYRTERESWTEFESHGDCHGAPCSFTAITRDGSTVTFGGTPDARFEAPNLETGAVRVWSVSKVRDRNGNFTTAHYGRDEAGHPFLERLSYTGNEIANQEPQRAVTFEYQVRPDSMVRFVGGARVEARRRLAEVRTYVDLDGDGRSVTADQNLVHRYVAEYELAEATRRSRIVSLKVCDAAGQCLPATTFGWQDGGSQFVDAYVGEPGFDQGYSDSIRSFVNINGDGFGDFCREVGNRPDHHFLACMLGSPTGFGADQYAYRSEDGIDMGSDTLHRFFADINADGRPDYCRSVDALPLVDDPTTLQRISCSIAGEQGFEPEPWKSGYVKTSGDPKHLRAFVDVDGDGRADFCRQLYHPEIPFGFQLVCSLTGSDGFDGEIVIADEFDQPNSNSTWFADVDGDGRSDYCIIAGPFQDHLSCALARDGGFVEGALKSPTREEGFEVGGSPRVFLDVNRDGLADYCRRLGPGADAHLACAFSTGTGFTVEDQQQVAVHFDLGPSNPPSFADVNGDGLPDFCQRVSGQLSCLLKTETGWDADNPLTWDLDLAISAHLHDFVDVDGDGLADFCRRVSEDQRHRMVCATSDGAQPDLVTTIRDGIGGLTTLEYRSMTDPSIYQKGDTAEYPRLDMVAPIPLLYRHTRQDRVENPSNSFTYRHRYAEAQIDRHRGWLGFRATVLEDERNGHRTTTVHSLDFPLTGMVLSTTTESLPTQALETPDLLERQSTSHRWDSTNGIYNNWIESTRHEHYTEGVLNYTLGKDFLYDFEHRNVIWIADRGDVDLLQDDIYSCFRYPIAPDPWWQAFFPLETKVSSTGHCLDFSGDRWNAEGGDLRWQRFDYDARMNLAVREYWDDVRGEFQTHGVELDSFGNVTTLTDPLGHISTLGFDPVFNTFPIRFETPDPKPEDPDFGPLVTRATFEPRFGLRTHAFDVEDRLVTHIDESAIDGFGRVLEVESIRPHRDERVVVLESSWEADEEGGFRVQRQFRSRWDSGPGPDASWIWSRDHFDGLGRHRFSRSKGPHHNVDRVSAGVGRNDRGLVSQELLPYFIRNECVFYAPGEPCHEGELLQVERFYDLHGRPSEAVSPTGADTKTTYALHDDRKLNHFQPDPRAAPDSQAQVMWSETHDSRGHSKKRTGVDGSTSTTTYDLLGRLVSVVDALGQETLYSYDSLGRLIEESNPNTGTLTFRYGPGGAIESSTDAEGNTTSHTYDPLGRPRTTTVRDPDDTVVRTTTYDYDDPEVRNGLGRLTRIESPEGTYRFAYDNLGRTATEVLSLAVDDDPGLEEFVFEHRRDALGRPSRTIYPDGSEAIYRYHPDGNLAALEYRAPGASESQAWARFDDYTALGEIGSVWYQNGVESTYRYDVAGRPSQSRTFKVSRTHLDFEYTWNLADRLRAIHDNTGRGLGQSFEYDENGRLVSASGPYPQRSYQYNATGDLTATEAASFDYDSTRRHQLRRICALDVTDCSDDTARVVFEHDAGGFVTAKNDRDNDIRWRYVLDADQRLTEIRRRTGGSPEETVAQYTYDFTGQRRTKSGADGSTTFYISPLYEVVTGAATGSGIVHTKYLMGPQGPVAAISTDNRQVFLTRPRLALADPGPIQTAIGRAVERAEVLRALRHANAERRWYLVAGVLLLLSLPVWLWGSLAVSRSADASRSRGPLWRRPARAFAHALACFALVSQVMLPSPVLADLTPGPNGAGVPVAGRTLFFHHDHLGSDTLITNPDGASVASVAFEPYGAIAEDASTGEDVFRPKFTNKEHDAESGLVYFGSRYLDPSIGRFTAPDPARQYHSPYVYGDGSPTSGVDPDGEFFTVLLMLTFALVGAYVGGAIANHSANPATWDWKSGKTWAGIVTGAAVGVALVSGGAALIGAATGESIAIAGIGASSLFSNAIDVAFLSQDALSFSENQSFENGVFLALDLIPYLNLVTDGARGAVRGLRALGEGAARLREATRGIEEGGRELTELGRSSGELDEAPREIEGGCSSFPAGTTVATADGDLAIEEITVGDEVWARAEGASQPGLYPVSRILRRETDSLVLLTVDGTAIATTPEHPFFVEGEGWVEAKDLVPGALLVQREGGTVVVETLEVVSRPGRVYNFEVEQARTYFVSDAEVWVHNPCDRETANDIKDYLRNNVQGYQNIGNRNIALVEVYDVPNPWRPQEAELVAFDYAISGDPIPLPRRFPPRPVPAAGGGVRLANFDSELGLLEGLERNPDLPDRGVVYIYSEFAICESCANAILLFRERHPNLQLIVREGFDQWVGIADLEARRARLPH